MKKPQRTVLLIEDAPEDREIVRRALAAALDYEYKLLEAATGAEGLRLRREQPPDCILLDYELPDSNGLKLLAALVPDPLQPALPVIMMTDGGDETLAVSALKSGAQDYLIKGRMAPDQLRHSISSAIEKVTAQRQIAAHLQQLAESEARFSAAFHNSSSVMCIISETEVKYVEVNRAGCELFGYSREEVIGHSPAEFDFYADPSQRLTLRALLNRDGFVHDFEVHWKVKGGAIRTHLLNADRVTLKGQPCQFVVSNDITERKQAEEKLRTSEAFSHTVLESSPDCIKIIDAAGRLEYMNANGLCLLEIDDFALFKNEYWWNLWDEETQPVVKEAFKKALRGETVNFQAFCSTAKSIPKWWDVIVAPIRGADGKTERLVSVSRDITEAKLSEEKLRTSEEHFRTIFATTPVSIWEKDFSAVKAFIEDLRRQGVADFAAYFDAHPEVVAHAATLIRVRDVNEESLKLFGAASKAELFASITKSLAPGTSPRMKPELVAIADGARFLTLECPVQTVGGERRDTIFSIAFPAPNASFDSVLATFADITERKQLEAQREEILVTEQSLREVAEAASRAKDEFLSVVSHELRNPLNTIIGYNRLLRQAGPLDDATRHKYLDIIEKSARRQQTLIEDLLDTARIISGKLQLDIRPLNFVRVLQDTLDAARPTAATKQITLSTDLAESLRLGAEITGDPDRLQQVIWNLLSNAIKFTPERGAVMVRLARTAAHLQLTITDTGKGLSPETLPQVFARFHQADSSSTRRQGGLGLGLALVKQLMELHGGTIAATSPGAGQGATFTITLPLRAVPQPEPAAPPPRTALVNAALLSGLRILVVDDEPEGREIITFMLRAHGAEVTTVASATAALAILVNTTANPLDLIVSDIGMPDVDGYELMRQVRQQGLHMPAIAVTAFGRTEDRLRALTAGYQMHVPKPVEAEELLAIIASLRKRQGASKK